MSEAPSSDKEELLSLSIIHLDSWQQRSAQAQLSAGTDHSCGIKADGAVACWGIIPPTTDQPDKQPARR